MTFIRKRGSAAFSNSSLRLRLLAAGVGWAALDTPAGTISVFNTHLSANYGQRWQTGARGLPPHCRLPRDSLAGVRLLQVCANRRWCVWGCAPRLLIV